MGKKAKQRRQSHGSAWLWKQTDSWYYTTPREKGEPSVGVKMWVYRGVYVPLNVFDSTVNDAEQLMKQVAVGRKNWLFIGSLAAGGRAADLMTLVSSALRNDLDVRSYVKGVLDALLSGSTDYEQLRPDVWAAAHPD